MGSLSKYWQLVKLDLAGKPRVEMMIVSKTHFQKHFPEWTEQVGSDMKVVVRHNPKSLLAKAIRLMEQLNVKL